MGYVFQIVLTWLVIVSGIVAIIDTLFFAPKRIKKFHHLVEGDSYVEPPVIKGRNAFDTLLKTLPVSLLALFKLIVGILFWKKEWYWKNLQKTKQSIEPAKIKQYCSQLNPNIIVEYCKSFFPVLLLVLIIRSFIFSPYVIPSGSLEPTLLPGDFVIANKYDYGLRFPITHAKLTSGDPKIGDIFIFRFPPNPKIDYIKRVIALPGDTVSYKNKVLYINGKIQAQKTVGKAMDLVLGKEMPVLIKEENLMGVKHKMYINPAMPAVNFKAFKVPPGYYFAMGDNRDDSADSRYWGLVPEKNIIGKATVIWLSKTPGKLQIRWHRLGEIH